MRSELTTWVLEDCLETLIDYRGKTPKKTGSGIPLVTAKVVKSGRIESPNEFIAPEDFDSWMTRGLPKVGDVVMTTEAPLGEVGQLQKLPVALAQRIVTLRGKSGVLHNDYLLYALQSEPVQAQLRGRASGTTVVGIKQSELRKVRLDLPSFETQCETASVLKELDARIDLLRQTNATLESIAQALFKSWFIDFDPVRAKAEGREPEGMDAAMAALFPAEFEESVIGLIPKGWQARSLDSFAAYLNGLALQKFPAESDDEYLPVIKIAQLRAGSTVGADRASAQLKPEYIVRDGDVLFSWSGSLEVEFWCGGDGALNQHLFKVTSGEVPKWFYYLATRHFLPSFREIAAHKATTMGHIQRKHLTEAKIAMPPESVMSELGRLVAPLLERRVANALQARELVNLRDTLLPRLISGKLRLPEAQAQLEEAIA